MTGFESLRLEEVESEYRKYLADAESAGYHLNPDIEFTQGLISGLLVNEARYGYQSCPCRLAFGNRDDDLDIICPCDYRDQDIVEHGACYCALYISSEVAAGTHELQSIPDRRPPRSERKKAAVSRGVFDGNKLPLPVWRCKVCGYLCARDGPPETCPICKANKERFEQFI